MELIQIFDRKTEEFTYLIIQKPVQKKRIITDFALTRLQKSPSFNAKDYSFSTLAWLPEEKSEAPAELALSSEQRQELSHYLDMFFKESEREGLI